MGLRKCDGSPGSGITTSGAYCHCGCSFDDTAQEMVYPHAHLSKYSYNYYGTAATFPLSSYGTYPPNIPPMSTAATYYNPVPAYSIYPNYAVPPNKETFEKADLEQLAAAYTTVVKPGDRIVICVDVDTSDAQIAQLAKMLDHNSITGLIVRGARAGAGFPPSIAFPDPRDRRLDTMARILDCWEQRPDLRLAQLLSWFTPELGNASDDDFAAATEVYFKKVFGGVHGENK